MTQSNQQSNQWKPTSREELEAGVRAACLRFGEWADADSRHIKRAAKYMLDTAVRRIVEGDFSALCDEQKPPVGDVAEEGKPGLYQEVAVPFHAIQWTGRNVTEIISFIDCEFAMEGEPGAPAIFIPSENGGEVREVRADVGDWIIRWHDGEFDTCSAEKFAAGYVPATPSQTSTPTESAHGSEAYWNEVRAEVGRVIESVATRVTSRDWRDDSAVYLDVVAAIESLAGWLRHRNVRAERLSDLEQRLRERAAHLLEMHPDELDEPYEGAGYCSCETCQIDVPLLEQAARAIGTPTESAVTAAVREQALCDALALVLRTVGVLNDVTAPSGPELIAAAEHFAESIVGEQPEDDTEEVAE